MKIILLFLLLAISLKVVAKENYNSITSFNCNKAVGFIEQEICNNKDLALKDRILSDLFYGVLNVNRDWSTNDHRSWLKNRSVCENAKCISLFYVMRITELIERINDNETGKTSVTNLICGAAEHCNLVKRLWLGVYKGNNVFYDKVKALDCYKGCRGTYIKHHIYEVKNAKIIRKTAWSSQLINKYNIEPEPDYLKHQNKQGQLYVKNPVTIVFTVNTGEYADGIVNTNRIQRTENGWRELKQ